MFLRLETLQVPQKIEKLYIWWFPKKGGKPPKWMVYMEHPIKMDNLGVPPKHPYHSVEFLGLFSSVHSNSSPLFSGQRFDLSDF